MKITPRTILLISIIVVAFILRIFGVANHDMASDDALYSFRSIGYFDYVASTNLQSTPVTWFPEAQWWQSLSFHDHPPLVFLIQHIFFKIGGVNSWSARLPFVLAGTLSVLFLFLLGEKLFGTRTGFVAAILLTISNYGTWISRIGLLDGFLVLWIILSLYFFAKAQDNPKHYYWWALFCAAGVLTKYTFLFMAPVFLFGLWQRRACKERILWKSGILFLLLLSPLIIYNSMMFITRGHFDAALSSMMGQHPNDFVGLIRSPYTSFNILTPLMTIMSNNFSIGLQILLLISICIFLYHLFSDLKHRTHFLFILLGAFFALISLSLVGGDNRFGVIMLPFLMLILGFSIVHLYEYTEKIKQRTILWYSTLLVVIIVGLWELLFTFQSQLLVVPFIKHQFFISANLPSRVGYRELETYVADFYKEFPGRPIANLYTESPQLAAYQDTRIQKLLRARPDLPPYKHLLVYDDRLAWFPSIWTFERRYLYEAAPIHSLSRFIETINTYSPEFYTRFGLEDVTIITPTVNTQQNSKVRNQPALEKFINKLTEESKPIDIISNTNGAPLFTIFRIPL
ncbi:MAG: glycosyltransferase family 39 protein [bacterium]|nr:glycosyltransferase family 39 protein [bacterium]